MFGGAIVWLWGVAVVALAVVAQPPVASTPQRCPDAANEKIQYCVQPVADYAKILNQHDNSSSLAGRRGGSGQLANPLQLPKIGGQLFRELCRLIRDFQSCVEVYRDRCPKHITINLIEASYGYLCNEGYDTFMASAECLMDLDQQPDVKHCHDETLHEIETANTEATLRMETKLGRMCGALNYFAACVRNHIWQSCGMEAWHVIFRVLKDTTRTLMPGCVFNGESAKVDAERREREQQLEAEERRRIPPTEPIRSRAPQRSIDTELPLSGSEEHADQLDRSDESLQRLADPLTSHNFEPLRPEEDRSISFEIHEEPERPYESGARNYARLGVWSSASPTRSHLHGPFLFLFLSSFALFRLF